MIAPEAAASVSVLVVSYGRPIYLWNSLDALYRHTRSAARIVLVDNWHPDRQVDAVINAFVRRGLLSEVHRFPTNSPTNILSVYEQFLRDAGPTHVYMESDAAIISPTSKCWLSEMSRIFAANPRIGMLGSLIDTQDFVTSETCAALEGLDSREAVFLAKLKSTERGFLANSQWSAEGRDFFYTEPPCPIENPPGRLLMLDTEIMRAVGPHRDSRLAEEFRKRDYRPAVTPRVRHRHLSLLNIFDYPDYSEQVRNGFFNGFSALPTRERERSA